MRYTLMDMGTLMDLSMATGEKISYSWSNVSNYKSQPSHINLVI